MVNINLLCILRQCLLELQLSSEIQKKSNSTPLSHVLPEYRESLNETLFRTEFVESINIRCFAMIKCKCFNAATDQELLRFKKLLYSASKITLKSDVKDDSLNIKTKKSQ